MTALGCSAPCVDKDAKTLAIDLPSPIDLATSRVETLAVGSGRSVLHVVLHDTGHPEIAWEALVSGAKKGGAQVLFSGLTGFAGEEGVGGRVLIDGATIYVGEIRRALTLCGQRETLLAPRRLDVASMTLHAIAMPRLSKDAREKASPLAGVLATRAPIGSTLGLRGASTNDSGSAALVDDDPSTVWTEGRKGDGRGEFVVFSAPKALPLERLSFVVRPTKPFSELAQPTSIYVVLDDATFRVTIPEVTEAGARVDVVFPAPRATTCVGLELDKASMDPKSEPNVGLAEVEGVPVVPATIHTLDDVVTLLDDGGNGAELAKSLLVHAASRGATTVIGKLGSMGDGGKALAVEVLESTPCEAAAPGLVRLAWDAPKEATVAARIALDACGGKAKDAIAKGFLEGGGAAREILAERFAKLSPQIALAAILDALPTATPARRRTFRKALARVVDTSEGRAVTLAWIGAHVTPPPAGEVAPLIELARAIAGTVAIGESTESGPLLPPLAKALLAHAAAGQPFERRWLAAEPLAMLAARAEPGSVAWLRTLFAEPDRYLRARASEVGGAVEALRPELLHALGDVDPRVRQRTLEALRKAASFGATPAVKTMLAADAWTYVRIAAAELLGDSPSGADVDQALATATRDDAKSVRMASLRALASRGAHGQLPAVRARAFDADEAIDVRRDAVEALGILCDQPSADALFELARHVDDGEGARVLGLAAIVALGELHPKDLAQRLAALDSSVLVVKDAVGRALRAAPKCGK